MSRRPSRWCEIVVLGSKVVRAARLYVHVPRMLEESHGSNGRRDVCADEDDRSDVQKGTAPAKPPVTEESPAGQQESESAKPPAGQQVTEESPVGQQGSESAKPPAGQQVTEESPAGQQVTEESPVGQQDSATSAPTLQVGAKRAISALTTPPCGSARSSRVRRTHLP
jgi:hypothetical protein